MEDLITTAEKIALLGKEYAIDTKDYYGKWLILNTVLCHMSASEADKFMTDSLSMLDNEIDVLFKKDVA